MLLQDIRLEVATDTNSRLGRLLSGSPNSLKGRGDGGSKLAGEEDVAEARWPGDHQREIRTEDPVVTCAFYVDLLVSRNFPSPLP
jgi:hypothetical protein